MQEQVNSLLLLFLLIALMEDVVSQELLLLI